MQSKQRYAALGISLAVMGSMLAACSSNNDASSDNASPSASAASSASASPSPSASEQNLKPVTLKIFLPGDDRPAKQEVLDALYEKTKDRLNAKIELNFVPFGDYQQKLTMLASSGDEYDAAFTADWYGYSQMVNKGAFLDLSELAPQYAPNLYKLYEDNNMLSSASVNGKLMALPWTEIKTSKPVFQYRKDIADKLGVEPGDLSTIEGIDSFLEKINKANPGVQVYYQNMATSEGTLSALLEPKYEYLNMGFHSLYMDLNDPAHKVVPVEQTPMFKEAVTLAKKWYDEGIISKNILNDKTNQPYENSNAFSQKNTNGALYEKTNFTDKSAVNAAVEVYPDNKFVRDSQMNNAMAINKNAANPERMLMFMDLLTTDREVYDLFFYGIQDKTYSLDASGNIDFAPGEDPSKPLWQNWFNWGFERADFVRPTVSRPAEAIESEYVFATRPNILVSPIAGLVPITDNIKTELANRDQLVSEEGKLLLVGIVKGDIDQAIDSYIEKQKAAGLDKVLAEVQKQVDAFINK
ncbi:extracellular solute-binding protein [Cohnella fermenti]|uniref:Extracellular solute-binding protein n=1 Tax=Cohnella fermenti TaxID=2565925 RepID=A0A4S4BXG5_9BACL|nr:extracellular solute-binding protein [Cohnella fermenti]THF77807.1 extracellular solute-binding protein [Cohnella fermenti]